MERKRAGVCKTQVERGLGTGRYSSTRLATDPAAPEVTLGFQLNGPLFSNPTKNALPSSFPGRGRGALGSSPSQGCPSHPQLYSPNRQLCDCTAPLSRSLLPHLPLNSERQGGKKGTTLGGSEPESEKSDSAENLGE